jgi:hypothetical protein
MSAIEAGSRGIERPGRAQNFVAPDGIATVLEAGPIDKVHWSPDEIRELVLHPREVEQTPPRLASEGREQIHVTLRIEVAAQDGPEKLEANDLPLAAKRFERWSRKAQRGRERFEDGGHG